ncbi:hypothetical protein E8E13_002709 [Curvularia kusanoi]|uniref:Sodium/calcium exchanger membrane region domain-containing protein n=1 Tax=Curvularia kusanoi TaxID=90978 RepID=A0A9P4WBB6_CURKU|nr:hypothetical protein E8E13_002709 [Curvularia kusanoi]
MANAADAVAYNIAAFVTALFLLEFGADKFIDHTAIVAHRTNVPETVIGLVTAGAEWEELIVVIASLARNRASLAIGNIIGSAISNILGAFSLGLLFHSNDEAVQFDRSSRVYSLVLFAITTFTAPILYLPSRSVWLLHGILLIASFAIYIASVGWAISRGSLTAPEGSDTDSSDGSDSSSDDESSEESEIDEAVPERRLVTVSDSRHDTQRHQTSTPANPTTPLLPQPSRSRRRTLSYHLSYLILGFLGICLAGYVLSHAATTIVDELQMSDLVFGVVVLAIATTLPEKFIAVMSGQRGHTGVLIANTAGSNIFLLTLCLGIVVLSAKGSFPQGSVGVLELSVLWASTATFTATVWFGARFCRWAGGTMLVAYIVFIVLEFL